MNEEIPAPQPAPKTGVMKSSATQYFNWEGYFSGMYVSAIRAASGAFLAFSGTNTVEAVAPVAMAHIGLSLQQAAAAAFSALLFDVVRYVNLKPLPDVQQN